MAAWARGDQLGPYRLLAPLGVGGMGEVWKARDTRLERVVAVKRLKGNHSGRFEQEARAIAALNHPHICQIHDIGPDYLVLEYVEGKPLAGPLPPAEVTRLARQIADALEAAHRKGVIHRDLKPANIMVTSEGAVKLLDFGIAKQLADSEDTQTMEGRVVGTAAYMAPEQAEGKHLDARADVFSFGTVLYELLSGRRPFSGGNSVATMAAIMHKDPAPLVAPPALQQIVRRCLAKSPEERFQSMGAVSQALAGHFIPEESHSELARPSIAVLPFANMSGGQENDYFSEGLAEEIINALAQIPGLRVTARTSAFALRSKEQDIQKIALALNVKTVLEGSVRRAGNRIRVVAQLINPENGYHLWSQRYDREMADVFQLQDEIAQAIAAALNVTLAGAPAPIQQFKPAIPAYEALLRARYHLGRLDADSMPRAREAFEQAIALDPGFPLAHCEYARHFASLAMWGLIPAEQVIRVIREHATKALELDPSIPEGHAMLGVVAGLYDHDWQEAKIKFRHARTRVPVSPTVRWLHAMAYLLPTGRVAEAIQEIEGALQEDSFNLVFRLYRALCLAAAERDEEAFAEVRGVLSVNPNTSPAWVIEGIDHLQRQEPQKALLAFEKAFEVAPSSPGAIGVLAGFSRRSGDVLRADDILEKLPADAFGGPRARAYAHWICGDLDATADWFAKAIDQRDPIISSTIRFWYGRELRTTSHWARLTYKLNLPDA